MIMFPLPLSISEFIKFCFHTSMIIRQSQSQFSYRDAEAEADKIWEKVPRKDLTCLNFLLEVPQLAARV